MFATLAHLLAIIFLRRIFYDFFDGKFKMENPGNLGREFTHAEKLVQRSDAHFTALEHLLTNNCYGTEGVFAALEAVRSIRFFVSHQIGLDAIKPEIHKVFPR